MKEILFITRKWKGTGGMQQYSKDLWRGLRQIEGVHARLVAPRGGLGALLFPWRAIVSGVCVARRGGHIHLGDVALSPLGWFLKRCSSASVSITANGLDIVYPRPLYQWLIRRSLPRIDRIVCVSRAVRREAIARGADPRRIVVIPPGIWHGDIAPAPASPPRGKHILLTIGRLIERKGVAWFVSEVLPLLQGDFPDMEYWIIGDGPMKNTIKKIVQKRRLEHAVRLLGEVTGRERDAIIGDADLCVIPNIPVEGNMEGFGIACIEASARGIPVAAARLEGLCDAVMERETGCLFEPGNAAHAASVIRQMILHPMDRGGVSGVTLRHFSWPDLLRRYRHDVFHL